MNPNKANILNKPWRLMPFGRDRLEQMSETLASGERIEIRGFGSFSLHYRAPRIGRNPKTGESVALAGKHVPHFKPGKELRERVNAAHQGGESSG